MFKGISIVYYIKLWFIYLEESVNLKFINIVECCKNYIGCCLLINFYKFELFEDNI